MKFVIISMCIAVIVAEAPINYGIPSQKTTNFHQTSSSYQEPHSQYQTPVYDEVHTEVKETDDTLTYVADSKTQHFKFVSKISHKPEPQHETYEVPHETYEAPHETYEAPHQAYEAPHETYEAPHQAYEAPHQAYEVPHQAYEAPHQAYEVPHQTYEAPHKTYEAPKSQYGPPSVPHDSYGVPTTYKQFSESTPNDDVDNYASEYNKPSEEVSSSPTNATPDTPSSPIDFHAPFVSSQPKAPSASKPHHKHPTKPIHVIPTPPNTETAGKDNEYTHGFELDDGTKVVEHGHNIPGAQIPGWEGESVVAKSGSYEYISPEGRKIRVDWVADDKGFRAITH